ncbi:MAG TPA: SLBB domain-containing protein [Nitrospiria bacterium]|jgi:polysaccharide export outer membrane protein|nr:SLBB domain-containing protein [Nitrospiria bacterium]
MWTICTPSASGPCCRSVPGFFASALRRFAALLIGAGLILSGTAWSQDYVLGPRDVLNITVYDHKDLETKVRVSEDGKITFPLLGEIKVSGLTVQQLERRITTRLANGYIVHPHVGVFVEEFRVVVYVTGEVSKPGSFPYEEGMTVIKALSLAGGLTEKAAEGKMTVTRKGQGPNETAILVGMHDLLRPDDVLQVPEKRWVYVTGEVKKPGSYLFDEQMTILKAITLAGGLTDKAAPAKTEIIRKKEGKEDKIRVKMEDPLQPEDVVVVPESFF